jgi:hypothetical protein
MGSYLTPQQFQNLMAGAAMITPHSNISALMALDINLNHPSSAVALATALGRTAELALETTTSGRGHNSIVSTGGNHVVMAAVSTRSNTYENNRHNNDIDTDVKSNFPTNLPISTTDSRALRSDSVLNAQRVDNVQTLLANIRDEGSRDNINNSNGHRKTVTSLPRNDEYFDTKLSEFITEVK